MIRRYIIWRSQHAAAERLREIVDRANAVSEAPGYEVRGSGWVVYEKSVSSATAR